MSPVLYLATVLIIWDLVRNVKAERRFFGVRLTRVWVPLIVRYAKSICVGILLTIVALLLHIEVRPGELIAVAGITILLGLVRLRFSSTPYAISVFIVCATVATRFFSNHSSFFSNVWRYLAGTHVESWIEFMSVLYFGQLLLILWNRTGATTPILVASKRGRELGANLIQWSFIVPIGVFIPGGVMLPQIFTHFNWLAIIGTVSLAGLPGLMGWHGVVSTVTPKRVAARVMLYSGICAVLLTLIVWLIEQGWMGSLIAGPLAAIIAMTFPEWQIWRIKWSESNCTPICQPSEDGVVVLYAIKGSIAEQIGLKMGEIITHVNQIPVHSEYDLHFALEQNPAYAKLQVVDEKGEIRIVGSPIYAGERYQLGAVLVSQTGKVPLYQNRPVGFLQTLYLRFVAIDKQPIAVSESTDTYTPPLQG